MSHPRLAAVPEQPPRAVLYLRQSVHRDESISLDLQETANRDYCARRGYVVTAIIRDPGRSGRTFKRRRVVEAFEMIERGEADVIVLWRWSRLSRKRLDWAIALDRVESIGGRIESSTEPADVATASGRLQRGVLGEFAAFQSEMIGEGWREAHDRRTGLGLPANGKPRWGYTYNHDAGFAPDPVTGPVLASLYRRYTAGESAVVLAEWLRAHGYRTSPGYSASATGGEWTFTALLRMLDRGFGAGLILHRGQLLPGAHEPVITEEEWQGYLDRRAERRRQPSRSKGSSYALSGLVFCARCDRPMYPGLYGQRRQPKYRCETSAKRGKAACQGGYIMAALIEAEVLAWLRGHADDVDKRTAAMDALRSRALVAQQDTARLSREILRLDEALTRLTLDRALHPDVPDQVHDAARAELLNRRAALAGQVDAASVEARRHARPDPATFRGLATEWHTLPVGARRDTLRTLIRSIQVTTGRPRGTIVITPTWADD
ncbi:MAG TPA: recombinase family protein [Kribbellaceae bacterium]|jgi:DNA invertase Pin-like site-specific DNA recombinase